MNKVVYLTSGQVAKMAGVTIATVANNARRLELVPVTDTPILLFAPGPDLDAWVAKMHDFAKNGGRPGIRRRNVECPVCDGTGLVPRSHESVMSNG